MTTYFIGKVRFDGGSALYPVNCSPIFEGERVIVRMDYSPPKFVSAEVMSIGIAHKPCRNSVVCLEEDRDHYGRGPDAVNTQSDFEKFLKFKNFETLPVTSLDHFKRPLVTQEWDVAHFRSFDHEFKSDTVQFTANGLVILFGPSGLGYIGGGRFGSNRLDKVDGRILLRDYERIFPMWPCENEFQAAAKMAEGPLHDVFEESDDGSYATVMAAMYITE